MRTGFDRRSWREDWKQFCREAPSMDEVGGKPVCEHCGFPALHEIGPGSPPVPEEHAPDCAYIIGDFSGEIVGMERSFDPASHIVILTDEEQGIVHPFRHGRVKS